MENTKELALVKSEKFGTVQCDFWQNKNKEYFMTRDQIGTALGYSDPRIAITKIHNRNKARLDKFSTSTNLVTVEGNRSVSRDITIYSSKGVYEICRFSHQDKANEFMDWVWNIIDNLRTGDLQLSNGAVTMSPAVINEQYENLLGKMQSIESMMGSYSNRIDGMANAFLYIQKMLGGVDPFESKRLLSESKTWKQGAIEKVKKLVLEDKSQTSVNVTLRKIYTRMRNVYGVVFDQELKEYMNKYHPNKKPSVLELIDQKEALRNLFDSIFSGIKSRDEEHIEHPVPKLPKDIIRESISPLIQKYNDNTVGGRATYKKVYGAMPVCWNNRQTRYMKANNTSVRPSKFRLVETDNKLLKLFIKTVEDKLKK